MTLEQTVSRTQGLSISALTRIENPSKIDPRTGKSLGRKNPKLDTLTELAEALNIRIEISPSGIEIVDLN